MANIAYKYRIYPDEKQKVQLEKTFGCARFVYNRVLEKQSENHKNGIKHMSKTESNNWANRELKKEFEWLKEVDKFALTNSVYHCCDAFGRFFAKKGRYPKYKSKHSGRKSYTTNSTNGNIKVRTDTVQLPKLGNVSACVHRTAPEDYELKSATVSKESDGSYYVSILYSYVEKEAGAEMTADRIIGFDYKSDGLYVDSNGNTCDMPHWYRQSQKKLAKEQRKLKHKIGNEKGQEKSNNWKKQMQKISRIHTHIANQRKDYLHKKSTEIANQYDGAAVEDLNMRNMSNSEFGNGKATMDNGYGMFRSMLEYKFKRRGKNLVKVAWNYPSSQMCHCCGSINPKVKDLSVRKWICPECGAVQDRDINAAINIRNEGIRLLGLE